LVHSRPSKDRPTLRIDPLFQANAPALAAGGQCHVRTGCSHRWHTHPLYQTLIVIAGCGWAQREGGPIEEIHSGRCDLVSPPGEKHWHGAAPTTAMTHIAIQEALDGKVVDWMEKVSDDQYRQ
jgi:quercetin dioxygenase-like cupin family protein